MSDDQHLRPAKIHFRATILAALIAAIAAIVAAWIGLGKNSASSSLASGPTSGQATSPGTSYISSPTIAPAPTPTSTSAGTRAAVDADQPVTNPVATAAQRIERPCAQNTTFQCATTLPLGVRDDGEFLDAPEERYYRIAVDQPGPRTITLDRVPNSRSVTVTVQTTDYERLTLKRFKKGQPGGITLTLSAGYYFIVLNVGACCSGAPPTYSIVVR